MVFSLGRSSPISSGRPLDGSEFHVNEGFTSRFITVGCNCGATSAVHQAGTHSSPYIVQRAVWNGAQRQVELRCVEGIKGLGGDITIGLLQIDS